MPEMTPSDHVSSIRASLQMLDVQVGRSLLSGEGIADLKREVDNMRLRIWAIMTAEAGDQAPGTLERFRLRRAVEITSKITEELERGEISVHPELGMLEDLMPRLTQAIRSVRARGQREAPPS